MQIRDLLVFDASDEVYLGAHGALEAPAARETGTGALDTPPLSARRSWGPPEPDDGPLPLEAAILAFLARNPPTRRPPAG
ncbi:MAG: hypothetical protein JXB32_23295 [Deltaproteobacteria bacterium]|nr:hypothetical protein [Deltaproteobacteria bacterium]